MRKPLLGEIIIFRCWTVHDEGGSLFQNRATFLRVTYSKINILQFEYTIVYTNSMNNQQISGFQWDKGNRAKCQKHGVSIDRIEALFLYPLAILPDEIHSQEEQRYRAIGKTEDGRAMFVVFTLRNHGEDTFIRPISARYMHKKEVAAYEEENPDL